MLSRLKFPAYLPFKTLKTTRLQNTVEGYYILSNALIRAYPDRLLKLRNATNKVGMYEHY